MNGTINKTGMLFENYIGFLFMLSIALQTIWVLRISSNKNLHLSTTKSLKNKSYVFRALKDLKFAL